LELDFRMLFSLGTALCTVVASFIVVRQKVSELEKAISSLSAKYATIDNDLDANNMQTESLSKAVDVLREINSPKQLREATREQENHSVRLATIEAQTIPNLEARISKMEHLHNGRHMPIKD
jgi:outer membrane murein-binding lipoprotein Lpp